MGTEGARRDTGRTSSWQLLPAVLVVSAFTVWLTRGAWGQGQLLYRDFVSVPDPVLGPAALGTDGQPPRAVPLDAVMAVVDPVVPTWLQQQLMLAGCILLAGVGVAVLLRRRGQVAMVSGAALAAWNPYVAERLLLGQPPTLLAYSMTPWMVAAVRSGLRPAYRVAAVALAAAPAALTPWGAVLAAVVVLGTALFLTPGPRGRLPWAYAVLTVAWCLPWAVPALRFGSGTGDPDGAAAFAAAADSWAGTVGSVLTMGGIWAPAARLESRQGLVATACAMVVLALAAWGVMLLRRQGRVREANALVLAWAGPTVLVLATSGGVGLAVFGALQEVPGLALVRDTHRLLALPVLAVAVLFGVSLGVLADTVRRRAPGPAPALALSVAAVSLAVVTAPDTPSRLDTAYSPAAFPVEWAEVVEAVNAEVETGAGRGSVLALPWQPFRQVGWAGAQPFLDPLPRALRTTTLTSSVLTVPRDGEVLTVGSDPVEAARWRSGALDEPALRRLGIGYVVEWKGTPGVLPTDHDGLTALHRGRHFDLWALPSRSASRVPGNAHDTPTSR